MYTKSTVFSFLITYVYIWKSVTNDTVGAYYLPIAIKTLCDIISAKVKLSIRETSNIPKYFPNPVMKLKLLQTLAERFNTLVSFQAKRYHLFRRLIWCDYVWVNVSDFYKPLQEVCRYDTELYIKISILTRVRCPFLFQ